jgi:7-carboxy-7-deazaguanine synthase (Cx14CxxC type)
MTYRIKEIFYSLQGEGANTGRPAVFCRFSGCNLWSGKAEDRPRLPCRYCDTDFVGTDGVQGGVFDGAGELATRASALFPASGPRLRRLLVATGGEPLLQLDEALIDAFHERGLDVAVETNGTLPMPAGIDWVCVSPKAGASLAVQAGDELKLLFPLDGVDPEQYLSLDFRHFFLQPLDGPHITAHTALAVDYCLRHPEWRLSLQTHKILGIR